MHGLDKPRCRCRFKLEKTVACDGVETVADLEQIEEARSTSQPSNILQCRASNVTASPQYNLVTPATRRHLELVAIAFRASRLCFCPSTQSSSTMARIQQQPSRTSSLVQRTTSRTSSLLRAGRSLYLALATLLALSALLQPVQAVKFDLVASPNPRQKCIWNYAMSDTLVVITSVCSQVASLQRWEFRPIVWVFRWHTFIPLVP